ncbi:unnamed protein product [Ceutorhynchus assimilis]|uniref:Carboxylesterase type B domain-containing protein n=1 Tax=Ceutorhynchus assimilis TaxID=467358 RepID=A0A9P0DL57_9CUCU|nr:unnamed protein product [Ceutorhynchus assimilis]
MIASPSLPMIYFGGFCVLLIRCEGHATDPVVEIQQGKLKGIIGTNYDGKPFYEFLGIPYAKPPVEELRFQPPEPAQSWTGIRNANKTGDICISTYDFGSQTVGSEDCLYLNVYTRNLPESNSRLKPVMVFIYGGGLTVGSSGPDVYGPDFFMLKDIVLVTFNYRLGVLGFLSFDDPSLGVFGNMGLKDQNLALKWIKKNIRKFNGDPDNVTIFGESSGSASVHTHILSPASRGLFHKAIMQSGCSLNTWFWGRKNNAIEVVAKAGKKASTNREALDILKNLTALEIFTAQQLVVDNTYPAGERPFSAVIEVPNDRPFLTENPIKLIKDGAYNQVPIIMGYVENEGMIFDLDIEAAEKLGLIFPNFNFENMIPYQLDIPKGSDDSKAIVAKLSQLYSGKPASARYDPLTDSYVLAEVIEALKYHLENSLNPIYVYRVSLAGKLNRVKLLMNRTDEPGTCHGDELGYQFSSIITPTVEPGSLEDRSIRTFAELWVNFATYGNPTPHSNKLWKPVKMNQPIQVFDIGQTTGMINIPERERLDVWGKIFQKWPIVRF